MRYFLTILSCVCCLSFSQAQSGEDTLKINYSAKDLSLEQIFEDLEATYGIRFSYATESIGDKKLSADFEDQSLDEVINYLLEEVQMEHKRIDNNILLRKKPNYKTKKDDNYKKSLHLRGKVSQIAIEGEGLPFAAVSISGSPIGTYTDEEGNFDLEIPGEYQNEQLIIHYLGMEDMVFEINELEKEFLMVTLKEGAFKVEEVVVVNRPKPLRIKSLSNSLNLQNSAINSTTSGLAGADLSKNIQLLPGIAAFDDASADIKIRGSQADETLIILDGMPIYKANHYYGIFNAVNSNYVDTVNIYKNVLPLHYGGKTAGIVELLSNNEMPQAVQAEVEANLLTASSIIKVPLSNTTSLTLAGRSTLRDVTNTQFNTSTNFSSESSNQSISEPIANQKSNPDFRFWDFNGKFHWQPNVSEEWSWHFFSSQDQFNNEFKRKIEDDRGDELKLDAKQTELWSNLAGSMVYKKQFENNWKWTSTLAYTQFNNEAEINYQIDKKENSNQQASQDLNVKQFNNIEDIRFDTYLQIPLARKSGLKMGLTTTKHQVDYEIRESNQSNLEADEQLMEASVYVGYHFVCLKSLRIQAGLRTSYYDEMNQLFYSPRILANYQIKEGFSLKSSYSYNQQFIREFQYEYRGENRELWVYAGANQIPVLSSQNFMLGTTLILDKLTLDVEWYHKRMDGLLEYAVSNPGNGNHNSNQGRDYQLFKGNGYSNGMDVLLCTQFKKYNTYLAYTLSKTVQRYQSIAKNEYFPAEDDRRHQLKWINTYETGPLIWGMNWIYASGKPYTDIKQLGPDGDIKDSPPNTRYNYLPAYQRFDVSLTYPFKLKTINSTLSFSVFNVLNNKNVKYIQNVSTNFLQNGTTINTIVGNESSLLNRTFNLSWKVGLNR